MTDLLTKDWQAIATTRTILVPHPDYSVLEMQGWVNQGIADSEGPEETIIGWRLTPDGYLVALGCVIGWTLSAP